MLEEAGLEAPFVYVYPLGARVSLADNHQGLVQPMSVGLVPLQQLRDAFGLGNLRGSNGAEPLSDL